MRQEITCFGLLLLAGLAAGQVTTCATQQPCLTFSESACSGTTRQLCLGVNPDAVGCTLANNAVINGKCGLVGATNSAQTGVAGNSPACGTFTGDTMARFSVSDGAVASSGSPFTSTVAGRSASCEATSLVLCSGFTAPGGSTSTTWSFPVSSCTCSCETWSTWTTCDATCRQTRTRACTGPTGTTCTNPETETRDCTGGTCLGCSCSPTWGEWGTCSSSCQGGVNMRTRECTAVTAGVTCNSDTQTRDCSTTASCVDGNAFRCGCGGWTGWAACSNTCGAGSQTRTRVCTVIPPPEGPPPGSCPVDTFPISQTQACTGNFPGCSGNGGGGGGGGNGGCSCTGWSNQGSCSATCGLSGMQMQTRTCTGCSANTVTTQNVACNTDVPCPFPGPVTSPSPNTCTCTPWVGGGCSTTCGTGSEIQSRVCSGICPPTELETRYANCNSTPCGGFGGGLGGGGRRRGGRGGGGGRRRGCSRGGRTRAGREICRCYTASERRACRMRNRNGNRFF